MGMCWSLLMAPYYNESACKFQAQSFELCSIRSSGRTPHLVSTKRVKGDIRSEGGVPFALVFRLRDHSLEVEIC